MSKAIPFPLSASDLPVGSGDGQVASGALTALIAPLLRETAVSAFSVQVGANRDATITVSRPASSLAALAPDGGLYAFRIEVWQDQEFLTPAGTAVASLTPAGSGTVLAGTGTNSMTVVTSAAGVFSLRLTDAVPETVYVTYTPISTAPGIFVAAPDGFNDTIPTLVRSSLVEFVA